MANAAREAIGLIGVGIMGSAMAKNMVEAGLEVFGHDISSEATANLARHGGHPAGSNAGVAERTDLLITSLPNTNALREVVADLEAAPRRPRVLAETSTFPLDDKITARERLAQVGITMLDCPLSGSSNRAMLRDVLVYGSGDEAAYKRMLPAFQGFSRAPHYLGAFGNGSKMKYIANLLVAIHTASAGEAFALARKCGLDPAQTYDVIMDGAGGSRAMEARKEMLVSNEYLPVRTAPMDLFRKDLKVIGDFANAIDCPVPMFTATLPLYNAALANGMGADDTAAICKLLQQMAGIGEEWQPPRP